MLCKEKHISYKYIKKDLTELCIKAKYKLLKCPKMPSVISGNN